MDIEGLGKLIEANHHDTLRQFESVKNMYSEQKRICDKRMDTIEDRQRETCATVKSHGKTLTQIKTIGSLAALAWGAIVTFIRSFIGGA